MYCNNYNNYNVNYKCTSNNYNRQQGYANFQYTQDTHAAYYHQHTHQNQDFENQTYMNKNQPCKFFMRGNCLKGSQCRFSHEVTPSKKDFAPVAPEPETIRENTSQLTNLLSNNTNLKPTVVEPPKEAAPPTVRVDLSYFDILSQIGDGLVGKIFQVRLKSTGQIYAMKVILKEHVLKESLEILTRNERTIMMEVSHPFISKLHFAFQTNEKLYMIMDYQPGGDLEFHLNNSIQFDEERARFYAAEIILALEHLHNLNILYRDLKAGNTLLDAEGHICLSDFGMSKRVKESNDVSSSFCGTSRYMAPEIVSKYSKGYGMAVDWWSLGVLLYQMLVGECPFGAHEEDDEVIYAQITKGQLQLPQSLSKDAQSVIRGLLHRDPTKRLRAPQIKSHPFFKTINWAKLERKEVQPPWKPFLYDEEDVCNFPSNLTEGTPVDSVPENAAIFPFDQFTYASPTSTSVILSMSMSREEHSELILTQIEEDETEEFEVPEDACFGISL